MNKFFEKQTDSSRIKANIVAEYFPQYSRILLKREQKAIRYLDLFAGPGMYKDNNPSTPILIAQKCAQELDLRNKVQLLFNDNKYSKELEFNFNERFPPETFTFPPRFGDKTVGEDNRIRNYTRSAFGIKREKVVQPAEKQ